MRQAVPLGAALLRRWPPSGSCADREQRATLLRSGCRWDTSPRAGCCEVAAGYRGGNHQKTSG
jgi:hypothetical protein